MYSVWDNVYIDPKMFHHILSNDDEIWSIVLEVDANWYAEGLLSHEVGKHCTVNVDFMHSYNFLLVSQTLGLHLSMM